MAKYTFVDKQNHVRVQGDNIVGVVLKMLDKCQEMSFSEFSHRLSELDEKAKKEMLTEFRDLHSRIYGRQHYRASYREKEGL